MITWVMMYVVLCTVTRSQPHCTPMWRRSVKTVLVPPWWGAVQTFTEASFTKLDGAVHVLSPSVTLRYADPIPFTKHQDINEMLYRCQYQIMCSDTLKGAKVHENSEMRWKRSLLIINIKLSAEFAARLRFCREFYLIINHFYHFSSPLLLSLLIWLQQADVFFLQKKL